MTVYQKKKKVNQAHTSPWVGKWPICAVSIWQLFGWAT